MGAAKALYPTKAKIARALDAAREAGIKIGGYEIAPDGTIRVLSEASASRPVSAYDEWKVRKAKQA